MSLAGLLCVVIPSPCGWVEFVDLLHAVFLRAGSQVLLEDLSLRHCKGPAPRTSQGAALKSQVMTL